MSEGQEKNTKKTCRNLFVGFILGFLLLAGLSVLGILLAISATGLFEVPILSNFFKPPAIEEDFSYEEVSDKALEKRLEEAESASGKIDITLTSDEFNTLFSSQFDSSELPVKDVVFKFAEGVVKVTGIAAIPDDQNGRESPFYAEISLRKEKGSPLELDIIKARLGALSIPSFLANTVIDRLTGGSDISLEDIPVDGITVIDGAIQIKGLDSDWFE